MLLKPASTTPPSLDYAGSLIDMVKLGYECTEHAFSTQATHVVLTKTRA
jgi:hypothetical protein